MFLSSILSLKLEKDVTGYRKGNDIGVSHTEAVLARKKRIWIDVNFSLIFYTSGSDVQHICLLILNCQPVTLQIHIKLKACSTV